MRKDVKIGLALSVIMVVLAGWYYNRPKSSSPTIVLDDTQSMAEQLANRKLPPASPQTQSTVKLQDAPDLGRTKGTRVTTDRSRDGGVDVRRGNKQPNRALQTDQSNRKPKITLDEGVDLLGSVVNDRSQPQPSTKQNRGDSSERHRAKKGDTLPRLAEIYYGDKRLAHVLVKANPELPINKPLPVDATVRIPNYADSPFDFSNRKVASGGTQSGRSNKSTTRTAKRPTAKGAAGDGTYEVKKGDSFYAIAARELGSGDRWSELYAMNRDVVGKDPNRLRPGQVLKLPAKR